MVSRLSSLAKATLLGISIATSNAGMAAQKVEERAVSIISEQESSKLVCIGWSPTDEEKDFLRPFANNLSMQTDSLKVYVYSYGAFKDDKTGYNGVILLIRGEVYFFSKDINSENRLVRLPLAPGTKGRLGAIKYLRSIHDKKE